MGDRPLALSWDYYARSLLLVCLAGDLREVVLLYSYCTPIWWTYVKSAAMDSRLGADAVQPFHVAVWAPVWTMPLEWAAASLPVVAGNRDNHQDQR